MSQKRARKWYDQLKDTKVRMRNDGHEMWIENNTLVTRNIDNGIISKYDKYGFVIATEII
ncbi:hypothetical protein [Liquorilactobacillus mali]|uniref:Uncharacterized protein n=1 Tax=Liquorilactobacillus mali KCTC 3596 = DSM 20444 TaxID=1046596 RepID=A0A0R2E377_9LACO|nr:hypothetical protein [Liquorilactobacillus mali]KRN10760.1 hypothetical protein FD00_GL002001 [Liquorilactobacillus mali KCTC 3596 = DSM 20444]